MNLPMIKTDIIAAFRLQKNRATREEREFQAKRESIAHEMEKTYDEMEDTLARFNNTTEKMLIDMYSYELKALEQKYGYYLQQIKAMDEAAK